MGANNLVRAVELGPSSGVMWVASMRPFAVFRDMRVGPFHGLRRGDPTTKSAGHSPARTSSAPWTRAAACLEPAGELATFYRLATATATSEVLRLSRTVRR